MMDAETLDEVAPGVSIRYAPADWGVRSLNRYAIGDAIGEGTYGKVFKAHELSSGRREAVALKMMIRHHEDEGFPKTETREIKILKSLRHPNMVNLREVVSSLGSDVYQPKPSTVLSSKVAPHSGADPVAVGLFDRMGDIFMVFDYVDYDLAGLLESGYRFSVPQVKSIIYQLLMVLDYLHSHPQRFVHRDLKCANLLLTDDNVLKLGDFGLARSLIMHDPSAKLSNLVITLWYRAPEVLLGSTEYTGAVDMWSVGCILLELLTGRPAFPAKAEAEQVKNIIKVIGTPVEGSYLRSLPFWSRFTIDDTKPQLTEWLQRHDVFRDAELLHLITRMLEGDPNRRVTAREALSAKWFASAPRIDKDSPNAGLPRITATPGFKAGVDHHEFAAKQRRKAVEANSRLAALQQEVHRPAPGEPSGVWSAELDSSVQRLLRLPCDTREQRERAVGELRTMEQSLSSALQTMETQKGGLNSNQEPVRKQISLHIAEVRARSYEVQAIPADALLTVPATRMDREAALLPPPEPPSAPSLPPAPAPPAPAFTTSKQLSTRQERSAPHHRRSVSPRRDRGPLHSRDGGTLVRLPLSDRRVDPAEAGRSSRGIGAPSGGDRVARRPDDDARGPEESRRRADEHGRWLEDTRRRPDHDRGDRERGARAYSDYPESQRDYEDRSRNRGRYSQERERDPDPERGIARQDWERNWEREHTHERRSDRPRDHRARSRSRELRRDSRRERHESPEKRRDGRR